MSHKQFFAIQKKAQKKGYPVDRAQLIHEYTDGRTSSLSELAKNPKEYNSFMIFFRKLVDEEVSPEERKKDVMRKKVIAIMVHTIGWSMDEMHDWVVKYSQAHKPLDEHDTVELAALVSQVDLYYKKHRKKVF